MTDPQMPKDSTFEDKKQIIDFDKFKFQDIVWKDPERRQGAIPGSWNEYSEVFLKVLMKGEVYFFKGTKKYVHHDTIDDSYELKFKLTAKDKIGRVELDIEVDGDGEINTCIEKIDLKKELPSDLAAILYEKMINYFRDLAKRDDVWEQRKTEAVDFIHEIERVPLTSQKNFPRKVWYKIFGPYLAKHKYINIDGEDFWGTPRGDEWKKEFKRNNDFLDIELTDFDWEEGAVYDGDAQDVRIKPSTFQESIKSDGQEAIIQGSSRKYYKVTAEGKKFLHELVDLKLTIGEASVTIKLKFEGRQVSSEIISGDPEHQIDQGLIDSFVSKLDHYLKFKAIEDEQDYEYGTNVYRVDGMEEIVREFLKQNKIDLS